MQSTARFLTSILFLLFLAGCSTTKDVSFLQELAKDEKAKAGAMESDTKNYKKLKEALADGKVNPGMAMEEIRDRFGEPVVTTQEKEGTRFAYKPGPASWFGEQKIYLIFDAHGKLVKFQSAEKAASV